MKFGNVTKKSHKAFQTQWGEKKLIEVQMDNGAVEKFYYKPGQEPQESIQINDRVGVMMKEAYGKQVRNLVKIEDESPANNWSKGKVPDNVPVAPAYNNNVAASRPIDATAWAVQEAKNVANLISIVNYEMKNQGYSLSMEELRNVAISINIGLQRAFNTQQVIEFNDDIKEDLQEEEDEEEEEDDLMDDEEDDDDTF